MQIIKNIWNDAEKLSSLNYILAWIAVGLTLIGVLISSRLNPAMTGLAWIGLALALIGIAITAFTLLIGRQVDKLNKAQNSELQAQHDRERQDDLGIVSWPGKP
jgi:uncharacterized membrane protein